MNRVEELSESVFGAMALLAGMELGVFAALGEGGRTAAQLARELALPERPLQTLLEALVGSGLLEMEDGAFANGAAARRHLLPDGDDYVGPRHLLWKVVWPRLLHAADSVRAGAPQMPIDFAGASPAELEPIIRGLHARGLQVGGELAARVDRGDCTRLLDVGGGSGGVSIALCRAWPGLRATVAELPAVAGLTRRIAREEGMEERVQVQVCNVVEEVPPGRYDMALCKAYFQVLAAADCRRALRHIRRALRPGGRLLIVGDMLDGVAAPAEQACFGLFFLNAFPSGRLFYEAEYRQWLQEAGFVSIERLEQGVLLAERAS